MVSLREGHKSYTKQRTRTECPNLLHGMEEISKEWDNWFLWYAESGEVTLFVPGVSVSEREFDCTKIIMSAQCVISALC